MTSLLEQCQVLIKDKKALLTALNIRITEFYVKQKGAIKTVSFEWDSRE
jgi:hypothetical protein